MDNCTFIGCPSVATRRITFKKGGRIDCCDRHARELCEKAKPGSYLIASLAYLKSQGR